MHVFKTGDKVVLKDGEDLASFGFTPGRAYTVARPNLSPLSSKPAIYVLNDDGDECHFYESRFRAAVQGQDYVAALTPAEYIETIGKDSTGMILSEDPATCAPPPASTKASNPKEALGSAKLALHLVPDAAVAHVATAFFEGASKYGAYNWRVAGVRASTYIAACRRHMSKWWNGEDRDPVSKVHHLANAAACLCIIIDAEVSKMLNDDRPPKQDLDTLMTALAAVQGHLADLNAASNPPQYTEAEHGANKA